MKPEPPITKARTGATGGKRPSAVRSTKGSVSDALATGHTKTEQKKTRIESFETHIHRILSNMMIDVGISAKAVAVVNSFANDVFDRLVTESVRLAVINKRATLTIKEIEGSIDSLFPANLKRHAYSNGKKAVERYHTSFE